MFGFNKGGDLIVLRDADVIADELRHALSEAAADERPGLQRAYDIVARQCGVADVEVQAQWAARVLAQAGVDPSEEVNAVAAIRKVEPGIRLTTAVQLVKETRSQLKS